MSGAKRCAGCRRMEYGVRVVALVIDGALRVDFPLCRACATDVVDQFVDYMAPPPKRALYLIDGDRELRI